MFTQVGVRDVHGGKYSAVVTALRLLRRNPESGPMSLLRQKGAIEGDLSKWAWSAGIEMGTDRSAESIGDSQNAPEGRSLRGGPRKRLAEEQRRC